VKPLSSTFNRPSHRNKVILMKWSTFVVYILAMLLGGQVSSAEPPRIPVARITRIAVQGPPGDPAAIFAAQELSRYWQAMTGTKLPIDVSVTAAAGTITLCLDPTSDLKWDGYAIKPAQDGVVITARLGRGVLYGVYQYLEACGCSFVHPAYPGWEIVPRLAEAPQPTLRHIPRVEWRGITLAGIRPDRAEELRKTVDWMAKNRFNSVLLSQNRPSANEGEREGEICQGMFFRGELEKTILPELQQRQFVINMGEHNTHEYLDRAALFKIHPEWFALIGGKRVEGQICYSNPAAMDYYADRLISYVKANPWVSVIGTWPLDGGGYCTCPGCASDQTVYNAICRVAERMKPACPEVIVEYLAYKPETYAIPRHPMVGNMTVLFCPEYGQMPANEKAWVEAARKAHGVVKFDYNTADNWRSRAMVWINPALMVSGADYAAMHGFKGVQTIYLPISMWWRGSFNFWFQGLGFWEEQVDIPDQLRRYAAAAFGPHAADGTRILQRIADLGAAKPYYQPGKKPMPSAQTSGVAETSAAIRADLDRLLVSVKDPLIRMRLERLGSYLASMTAYHTYLASRSPADFAALLEVVRANNRAENGVDCPIGYFTRVVKGNTPPTGDSTTPGLNPNY
jgi:hypothetical protein